MMNIRSSSASLVLRSPSRPQCLLLLKTAAKRSRRTWSRRYPIFPANHWSPGSLTMRRGERRFRTPTQNRLSSSRTFCLEKSSSQVNDGPKRVYRAGESWYETPGSIHRVSRNASKTEPAKLLAVFVVDTDDKELTTPVKE